MKLDGVHHVTCITGDAPQNVEFYAGVLGLRLVKKTVNQDDPTVYHLFYADEQGSAGSDITFFEYPGAPPGRAGDGMVHRVGFRVGSEASLDFWEERVGGERATDGSLVFADPEGLELELTRRRLGDPPLTADAPDIPEEHRSAASPACMRTRRTRSGARRCLEARSGSSARAWEARGEQPTAASTSTTRRPTARGLPAAGTVHHVAWVGSARRARGLAAEGGGRRARSRRR